MKLLIISHTPHYLQEDQVQGWGSTVMEIDQLASLFDEVVHLHHFTRLTLLQVLSLIKIQRLKLFW